MIRSTNCGQSSRLRSYKNLGVPRAIPGTPKTLAPESSLEPLTITPKMPSFYSCRDLSVRKTVVRMSSDSTMVRLDLKTRRDNPMRTHPRESTRSCNRRPSLGLTSLITGAQMSAVYTGPEQGITLSIILDQARTTRTKYILEFREKLSS